jgi:WD40 repeat protein
VSDFPLGHNSKKRLLQENRMKDDKQLPVSHQKPVKTFEGYDGNIFSIVTFPDGKRTAAASADKTIRIWRLEDGAEMMKWVLKQYAYPLVLLDDGNRLSFPDVVLP